jgi:multisubunit Na+/H+ antiporter MnhB subunit
MITGQSITYLSEDQKAISCGDFSFKGGVTYLSYRQNDIFSILSLSDVPFTSGSLSIDDVQLTPTGFTGGQAKAIKLDVSDTGSLFLVSFYKGTEQEADAAFKKLSSELKALRFPAKTEEGKKDKIRMLMTVLSQNPISYILIDLNDPLVQKNRVLWEIAFLDYKGCAFFLSENPEKDVKAPASEKLWSKSALYLPYRIPLALTSFLAIFLACYAQSLRIKASSKWGLALTAAVVFLIANIVIGIFLAKKTITKDTKRSSLAPFEIRSTIFNVIGLAIALLGSWLLSSKEIFFAKNVLTGAGLASATLIGAALLFAQAMIGHAVSSYFLPQNKKTLA